MVCGCKNVMILLVRLLVIQVTVTAVEGSSCCATIKYKGDLKLDWKGWVLSPGLNSIGDAWSLHDQDYIHNRKKLINPLDSPVRSL
jgi:hypothetical protein